MSGSLPLRTRFLAPFLTSTCAGRHELHTKGPFDLLVLDGGGQGKGDEPPIDPPAWLRPRGLVVLDDFTPTQNWPPLHEGRPDTTRLYWLPHPGLLSIEVRTQPDAATIIALYRG
jgi:hypothetical protein